MLFQLPVTRSWLHQFVLCTTLIGHASRRGNQEMLDPRFDFPAALGWTPHVLHDALAKAQTINARQELSHVHTAALDELFQNGSPVLAVVEVPSTYCCALRQEPSRDAVTWGLCRLDLQEQGFDPDAFSADFAKGLRAGQALARPDASCKGDVFHAQSDLGKVVRFLDNRAYTALTHHDKLSRKVKADRDKRQAAGREQQRAIARADDVATLATWLRQDLLSVAGPEVETRRQWYHFVVDELRAREEHCPHRLRPLRVLLEQHRDELLRFAAEVDMDIRCLAAYAKVPATVVRELVAVQE